MLLLLAACSTTPVPAGTDAPTDGILPLNPTRVESVSHLHSSFDEFLAGVWMVDQTAYLMHANDYGFVVLSAYSFGATVPPEPDQPVWRETRLASGSVEIADFDGDGWPDLLGTFWIDPQTAADRERRLVVGPLPSDDDLDPGASVGDWPAGRSVHCGDLTGDGIADRCLENGVDVGPPDGLVDLRVVGLDNLAVGVASVAFRSGRRDLVVWIPESEWVVRVDGLEGLAARTPELGPVQVELGDLPAVTVPSPEDAFESPMRAVVLADEGTEELVVAGHLLGPAVFEGIGEPVEVADPLAHVGDFDGDGQLERLTVAGDLAHVAELDGTWRATFEPRTDVDLGEIPGPLRVRWTGRLPGRSTDSFAISSFGSGASWLWFVEQPLTP